MLVKKCIQYILKNTEHKELIWANPNPSSALGETIINVDTTKYSDFEIEYKPYATYDDLAPMARVKAGYGIDLIGMNGGTTQYTGVFWANIRNIDFTSNTQIAIKSGMRSTPAASWAYNNNCCLPIRIYGVRKSGGGTE